MQNDDELAIAGGMVTDPDHCALPSGYEVRYRKERQQPYTGRAALNARQEEAAFRGVVTDAADLRGWLVFYNSDSRRTQAGVPDLWMVRPPRVLHIELKATRGTLSMAQVIVLTTLRECPGVEAMAAWPQDWPLLEEVLR